MAKALIGIALWLCLGVSLAHAQTAKQNPTWDQLTDAQQRILAPIESAWEALDPPRKRKWLGIAQRYPKMSPKAQARLQRRMQEWVSLTPEQRSAARDKYKEFGELPAVREKWEEYKQARAAEDAQKAGEAAAEPAPEGTSETATETPAAFEGTNPSGATGLQQQQ
ncbi:MAG TPA: DUF3106 domain-containing protein [Burkholderiales bacterium]|nr:DUF3106 domain-containing protein [Burkholderiales bacterium]